MFWLIPLVNHGEPRLVQKTDVRCSMKHGVIWRPHCQGYVWHVGNQPPTLSFHVISLCLLLKRKCFECSRLPLIAFPALTLHAGESPFHNKVQLQWASGFALVLGENLFQHSSKTSTHSNLEPNHEMEERFQIPRLPSWILLNSAYLPLFSTTSQWHCLSSPKSPRPDAPWHCVPASLPWWWFAEESWCWRIVAPVLEQRHASASGANCAFFAGQTWRTIMKQPISKWWSHLKRRFRPFNHRNKSPSFLNPVAPATPTFGNPKQHPDLSPAVSLPVSLSDRQLRQRQRQRFPQRLRGRTTSLAAESWGAADGAAERGGWRWHHPLGVSPGRLVAATLRREGQVHRGYRGYKGWWGQGLWKRFAELGAKIIDLGA